MKPDPTTSLVTKILAWWKLAGSTLLLILSAACTYAYKQWTARDTRIGALEVAQTQAYTASSIDRSTLTNLANNFEQFRKDYRQDMHDVRQALMLPPARPADGKVAKAQ